MALLFNKQVKMETVFGLVIVSVLANSFINNNGSQQTEGFSVKYANEAGQNVGSIYNKNMVLGQNVTANYLGTKDLDVKNLTVYKTGNVKNMTVKGDHSITGNIVANNLELNTGNVQGGLSVGTDVDTKGMMVLPEGDPVVQNGTELVLIPPGHILRTAEGTHKKNSYLDYSLGFPKAFKTTPKVTVSLNYIAAHTHDSNDPLNIIVYPKEIHKDKFVLRIAKNSTLKENKYFDEWWGGYSKHLGSKYGTNTKSFTRKEKKTGKHVPTHGIAVDQQHINSNQKSKDNKTYLEKRLHDAGCYIYGIGVSWVAHV